MKTGFILFHCDDISKIAWERDKLIMENIDKTGTSLTSKAKRSLCYPTMVPRPAGYTLDDEDENSSAVLTDLSQSQPQPSKKRTYAEFEKENMELHSDIQKLENDVDKLAKECAEYEDKKANVEEELEKLKREQPIALIEKMKEHVLDLGHILKNSAALQASNILSPTASFAGSPVHLNRAVNSDKVFLFKEVLISESSLRKAKVALKTDGNSNKSRNNGIAIIMDALYQPEELANMSLSGNACPSMPGSKPKPAISKEVLNEIIGFMVRYWDQAYKGSILTEQQVKEAVSAKFMAVHTREKKQKKKMLANEAASPLTAGATNTVTVPITTTASITATDV
ncbi:uncharacterized protein LOC116922339 [Daphnia magna]|uniref:uncharacterized protein LOC116922339 n=1 Tax=Daphnia magna TaxID=35525 RepID=UPI001E1BC962|nr:uncharacterized protein LOC116922339 [Daphnia magna]